jgi:hypothetical protein
VFTIVHTGYKRDVHYVDVNVYSDLSNNGTDTIYVHEAPKAQSVNW